MQIRFLVLKTCVLFVGLVCNLFVIERVCSQEWPRFRGPNGAGVSDAKTIPVKWAEKDYNWKIALPGKGHAEPRSGDNY